MRAVTIFAIVALAGCGGERRERAGEAPGAVSTALGGETVARVGDQPISRSLVLAVARERGLSARDALNVLITEALLAHAAVKQGARDADAVRLATSAALSRRLLTDLRDKALAEGPFTPKEVEDVRGDRWLDFDRPEVRTVVHALVKKDVPNGEAVAQRLRDDLLSANGPDAAKSEAAFTERAKAFKVDGAPVHVETLSVAADGRVPTGGRLVEPFTKGAFAIADVFGTSEVVPTSFGWHVIRLLRKEPEVHATHEQLVDKLHAELVATRVRPRHDALLERLRAAQKIEVLASDTDLALPK